MTYEEFITIRQTLRHAQYHLKCQRGRGNCAVAIARNQAINLLENAVWTLQGYFMKGSEV